MRSLATLVAILLAFALVYSCISPSLTELTSAPVPMEERQIGDLQCNIARLKTVGALGKAVKAVKALAAQANGTSDATNIATAASSLASAQEGIKTIAGAILTGKTAPASARTQVGDGLENALAALGNVTDLYFLIWDLRADSRDTSDATGDINDALTAGGQVVQDCN
jgi:hypothetical protein